MTRLKMILEILLISTLPACVAPWLQEPLRGNKELNAVLEAYKKQNTELTARRDETASQGVRQLAITNEAGSAEPLVTAELERASLAIVVGRILREAGVSYAVEPGLLRGTVTCRLTKIPLIGAVNALLEQQGLAAVMRDGVMIIKEKEFDNAPLAPASIAQDAAGKPSGESPGKQTGGASQATTRPTGNEKPTDVKANEGSASPKPQPKPVVTQEVSLTHLDAPTAAAFLEALSKKAPSEIDPGLRFSSQPYTNTVFLSGSPDDVARAARALRGADRDPAHVVIEVLVVALNSVVDDELGTDLKNLVTKSGNQFMTAMGVPNGRALTYLTGVKDPKGLRLEIDLLVSRNKARIIARPYITTVSGRKAKIEITNDQYLIVQQTAGTAVISAPQSVTTGVKLDILPNVARDGKVRMDVSVEQSQFVHSSNENVATEVEKNLAQTTMQVESGQAILIGGMSQHRYETTNSGLPWLRHIPILNILFAKFDADSHRQEVLVYMVPYIVWNPDLSLPIPESDAFGPQEPRDLFGELERGGR